MTSLMMKVRNFLARSGSRSASVRQLVQPRHLAGLAGGVRGRQVVFGLQPPHGLRLLEAFGQGVDQDRVQPVDGVAVVLQQLGRGLRRPSVPLGGIACDASGLGGGRCDSRRRLSVTVLSRTAPSRRASASDRVLADVDHADQRPGRDAGVIVGPGGEGGLDRQ